MRCGGAWFIVVEWQSAPAVAKRVAKYSYNWGKLAKTGSGKLRRLGYGVQYCKRVSIRDSGSERMHAYVHVMWLSTLECC